MKPTVSEDDLSPLNKSDLGNNPVSQNDYDPSALVNSSDDENVSKFTFTLPDEDEGDITEPEEMEAESFYENVAEEITSDVDKISEVSEITEIADYPNLNYPVDVKPESESFTQQVPKEEVLEQNSIAEETSSARSEETKASSDISTNQYKVEEESAPVSKYAQSYSYDKGKKKSSTPKVLIIAIVAVLVLGGGIGAFFLFGLSDDNKENTEQVVTDNTPQPEENVSAIEPETIDEKESEMPLVIEEEKKEEKQSTTKPVAQEVAKKEEPKKQEPVVVAEPEPSPAPTVVPKETPVEPEPEKENIQYPYYTTIKYPTGNVYVGYINRVGKKDGKGTYTWTSGDSYEGDWKNDQATGNGTYYSREGWRYVGQFGNLKFHGQGEYFFANGKKRKGTWVNGQMQK